MARGRKTGPGDAEAAAVADAADAASGDAVKIMLKKSLVEAVVASSGVRRNVARPVVEAVLAELGNALARGEALNLPPLGKLTVNRSKEGANADVLILKLRRPKAAAAAVAPPAPEDDEEADPDY